MEFLRINAKNKGLVNTVFCDEIDADQIPGLYLQCHVGLIALDARHTTHNISGKFISYLQSGLPVMAIINNDNDLQLIIEKYQVGGVTTSRNHTNLRLLANSLLDEISFDENLIRSRCKVLATDLFSTRTAVEQIVNTLNSMK